MQFCNCRITELQDCRKDCRKDWKLQEGVEALSAILSAILHSCNPAMPRSPTETSGSRMPVSGRPSPSLDLNAAPRLPSNSVRAFASAAGV